MWAQKAEFTYKFANNLPVSHPLNVRAKEMVDAIQAETKGRVLIEIYPNNQLGSDTDMLGQIRSGGVEFFTLSGLILSTLVPASSITGVGFAFPDYDTVWKTLDGDLGAYIRAQITKASLVVMGGVSNDSPETLVPPASNQKPQPKKLDHQVGHPARKPGLAAILPEISALRLHSWKLPTCATYPLNSPKNVWPIPSATCSATNPLRT